MSILYTPSGRAGEYSDKGLACNCYNGCVHGCRYCYVPGVKHTTRELFHARVTVVKNALHRLEYDCRRRYDEPIFLSFTSDIFQPFGNPAVNITGEALKIIKRSGNNVRILTKGWIPAEHLELLGPGDEVGYTLTCDNAVDSRTWEPRASTPEERLDGIVLAKCHGVRTWASFEPVIDPDQTLHLIEIAEEHLDVIKVGKFNHLARTDWPSEQWEKRVRSIDWNAFARDVVKLLDKIGKPYVIKKDLAQHLEVGS